MTGVGADGAADRNTDVSERTVEDAEAGSEPGLESDEPPASGVEVLVHVHFAMRGSFPLRLADLFFADDGLYVAEYAYVTPLFGLAAGSHRREAAVMAETYDRYGLDAALVRAERVEWRPYRLLERVTHYDGGRFARAKLVVETDDATVEYRLHADAPERRDGSTDATGRGGETLAADLSVVESECDVDVAVREGSGLGFTGLLPGR